jgi:hypothetical protein
VTTFLLIVEPLFRSDLSVSTMLDLAVALSVSNRVVPRWGRSAQLVGPHVTAQW